MAITEVLPRTAIFLNTRSIDVFLDKAGTQNCSLADLKLKTLTILDLGSYDISDIQPLSRLTNLTKLDLGGNQISNLKPLAGLAKLTNRISDVKPLAGLTKLTRVLLDENPIAVKVCPVKPVSICRF